KDHEGLRPRPVQGAWVDHPCRSRLMLLRDMCVAVEEVVVLAARLQLVKESLIVAVDESDHLVGEHQIAERLVQRSAGAVSSLANAVALDIAVAEDEVCVAREQPDGVGVLDVAAVDDPLDLTLLDDLESAFHNLVTAVRVAEDGDAHENLRGKSKVESGK